MYKFLTRQEELLLLAIWRLQGNAYGMAIKSHLEDITASEWSFGAVYAPLSRILKKGLAVSAKGEPTPARGGKSKVFYSLTDEGKEALISVKKVHEASWTNLPLLEKR
ncbi:PadR family transcriptional regulator [candidate division KSB1 bacterium]